MYRIKRKVLLLIAGICIATVKIYGQTNNIGKISGKIVDAETNETIPYASAVLTDRKTKAQVSIVQSDLDGNFTIPNLANGVYTFRASYIGYQTMVRDSIAITGALKNINLGTIKMKGGKGNVLNEVTVTAKKTEMQLGIDKKVFSVEQSLVSEGGNATDVLQNVPSIQTDMDGNVSLRGASGVKVLIDGKQSLIAGGDVAQILKSIPASSIETIEVITNPSAKYDAEGQAGIINIVLKRNRKLGFNGNLALTAGNRDNYNGNASMSFQNQKVNLFTNYGYRYNNRPRSGYNNITYKNTINNINNASQNNTETDLNKGHSLKIGADYYVAPKSVLSLSGGLNTRGGDENEWMAVNEYGVGNSPLNLSNRNNLQNEKNKSYDAALDFSQKFKKPGQELTFNLSVGKGSNNSYENYFTEKYFVNGANTSLPLDEQKTNRLRDNKNFNVQLDYTLPLGKAGKLETGYRSQVNKSNSSTVADSLINNSYVFSRTLSNDFSSTDNIHAVYVNYQNTIGNFGYQVGLRGEDANLNTEMGAYDVNKNIYYTPGKIAYTRLYPSMFLTQKLKNDQQIQLNYSRRVNRPRGWDTNPFLDVSNPLNHRRGNVNLMPEDVHAFELSYSKFFKKATFIGSTYFRKTNDLIQRLRSEPDEKGVTLTVPENLTSGTSTGVELIGKFDLVKKWNFTTNFNLYHRKVEGVPSFGTLDNEGLSYNVNMTNNISLAKNLSLQFRADYRSKEVLAQGIFKAMYGFDAGAKMDLMNKNASLSFNVRNLFGTRKFQMESTTNSTLISFGRIMPANMGSLTFSYRFGKDNFGLKKKPKGQEAPRADEETF
ncbi:outer membrane beta-barrel protein [Pedobacter sp. UBA4863]|uniref:outer membrane beta-barrel protein n=1 Tax=Pedobacter sp. UBA4863 TaxID=1947060 RepID=UPI0025EF9877|nr:outer membrane beta-barrel protein [Pedobacter sp. UBA4863]